MGQTLTSVPFTVAVYQAHSTVSAWPQRERRQIVSWATAVLGDHWRYQCPSASRHRPAPAGRSSRRRLRRGSICRRHFRCWIFGRRGGTGLHKGGCIIEVEGTIQHPGKQGNGLRIGLGAAVFPMGNGLAGRVDADSKIFLRKPLSLAGGGKLLSECGYGRSSFH